MSTVRVWERGQPTPEDLESGDYIITFIGNATLAASTAVTFDLAKGRRIPYFGGHSLTVNRVDLVKLDGGQALLSVTCTLAGFPWGGLLFVLSAAFICLSLQSVERMVKSGPLGAATGMLLVVVVGVLVVGAGYLFLRSDKAGP